MKEDLQTEIGHWFNKLDDKYCCLVYIYNNEDVRETAEYFYKLALTKIKEQVQELDKNAREYFGISQFNTACEKVIELIEKEKNE